MAMTKVPARKFGEYNYSAREAIALARQLAVRLDPVDLPLLRTAIRNFVPRDDVRSDADAVRDAFIETFCSELEAQPQWPQ
jgi:hypothetical protein